MPSLSPSVTVAIFSPTLASILPSFNLQLPFTVPLSLSPATSPARAYLPLALMPAAAQPAQGQRAAAKAQLLFQPGQNIRQFAALPHSASTAAMTRDNIRFAFITVLLLEKPSSEKYTFTDWLFVLGYAGAFFALWGAVLTPCAACAIVSVTGAGGRPRDRDHPWQRRNDP